MAKFVNSSDSISASLLLWNDLPTQVSIEETYDHNIWPVTNITNEGPINFNVPPQPNGLLTDLHIVSKIKIQKDGEDITVPQKDISIVNNLANSLWGEVSLVCSDRTELCQSMKNAYAYQSFFNTALNSAKNREDSLFYNEAFLMDEGKSKKSEENLRTFWKWDVLKDEYLKTIKFGQESQVETEPLIEQDDTEAVLKNPPPLQSQVDLEEVKQIMWNATELEKNNVFELLGVKHSEQIDSIVKEDFLRKIYGWIPTEANPAASKRSELINKGQSLTLDSRFQVPLLNTAKCLPTNMKIRISLTKNSDDFLLLAKDDSNYSIVIEDVYLRATYYKVRDEILRIIEERLKTDPIPYFISKPEVIIRPVTQASRIIRINDIFNENIPPYAFFCLQRSRDFEGRLKTNPFTFVPFKRFNFYKNGIPYFLDPLEVGTIEEIREGDYAYKDFGHFFRQLYRTAGKETKGDCLVDSTNFHLNFIVGISFGADRSSLMDRHLNLQEKASSYLEIDLGVENVPEDLILITYAVYDRQIQIDKDRVLRIIE